MMEWEDVQVSERGITRDQDLASHPIQALQGQDSVAPSLPEQVMVSNSINRAVIKLRICYECYTFIKLLHHKRYHAIQMWRQTIFLYRKTLLGVLFDNKTLLSDSVSLTYNKDPKEQN